MTNVILETLKNLPWKWIAPIGTGWAIAVALIILWFYCATKGDDD